MTDKPPPENFDGRLRYEPLEVKAFEEESAQDKHISTLLERPPDENRFQISRSMAYSHAGVCFLIILTLAQLPPQSLAWTISLLAACVALPLAIADAWLYDFRLQLGPESYGVKLGHIDTAADAIQLCGFAVAIGALVYYVSPLAFWLLLGGTIVAAASFGIRVFALLERLWESKKNTESGAKP